MHEVLKVNDLRSSAFMSCSFCWSLEHCDLSPSLIFCFCLYFGGSPDPSLSVEIYSFNTIIGFTLFFTCQNKKHYSFCCFQLLLLSCSALWPFSTLGWPDLSKEDYKHFYPSTVLETGYVSFGNILIYFFFFQ
jgi:hypothetical protein